MSHSKGRGRLTFYTQKMTVPFIVDEEKKYSLAGCKGLKLQMRATVQKMRSMRERRQNNLKREKKKRQANSPHTHAQTHILGEVYGKEKRQLPPRRTMCS